METVDASYRRVNDLGKCIYCGSTEGSRTEEHIVPLALGGRHILEDAVCALCQKRSNTNIEGPLLGKYFLQARARYGFSSRRKKDRDIATLEFSPIDGSGDKLTTAGLTQPSKNFVSPVILIQGAEPPRLLTGREGLIHAMPIVDLSGSKDEMTYLTPGPLDVVLGLTYAQKIKIAHSYCHFLNTIDFTPFLNKGLDNPILTVGAPSERMDITISGLNYGLRLREEGPLVIVTVQLFSAANFVFSHDVIVGGRAGWERYLEQSRRTYAENNGR